MVGRNDGVWRCIYVTADWGAQGGGCHLVYSSGPRLTPLDCSTERIPDMHSAPPCALQDALALTRSLGRLGPGPCGPAAGCTSTRPSCSTCASRGPRAWPRAWAAMAPGAASTSRGWNRGVQQAVLSLHERQRGPPSHGQRSSGILAEVWCVWCAQLGVHLADKPKCWGS